MSKTEDIIARTVAELTHGLTDDFSKSQKINGFVRENVLYYLDDWDTDAATVLKRMRGMCSGKTALSVAMHRALGIPARYKIIKLRPQEGLLDLVTRRIKDPFYRPGYPLSLKRQLIESTTTLPSWRDHLLVEVFLNGLWQEFEISRDKGLEEGTKVIGIWHPQKEIMEAGSFDSIDEWLKQRMARRSITVKRGRIFKILNKEMENVRKAGLFSLENGLVNLTGAEIDIKLHKWTLPDLLPLMDLKRPGQDSPARTGLSLKLIAETLKNNLASLKSAGERADLEKEVAKWLFRLIRLNIKRGRASRLNDVLNTGEADCLGYTQLLQLIGNKFSLDIGTAEVIIDNRGKTVPHYVNICKFADSSRFFIDLWYGAEDIRHKRLGLVVKTANDWEIKDIDIEKLDKYEDVRGLPPECISASLLYILGNNYLKNNPDKAIECYDISTWLYPANPRPYFNRAVARELKGDRPLAQRDYRFALRGKSNKYRIMASIEDLESLISLDAAGLTDDEQRIYLLRKGFITGRKETAEQIALLCHLLPSEVIKYLDLADRKLANY